jgi:hypothetical protein
MRKPRVDRTNTDPKYWEDLLEKAGLGNHRIETQDDDFETSVEAEVTQGRKVVQGNKDLAQLRTKLDGNDAFLSGGHQIKKIRAHKRRVPSWTANDAAVQKLLLRSFPKLQTSAKQRKYAGRWARIIHLFYRIGMSRTQVAKEMRLDATVIKDALRSIKRASRGIRANNSKARVHPTVLPV